FHFGDRVWSSDPGLPETSDHSFVNALFHLRGLADCPRRDAVSDDLRWWWCRLAVATAYRTSGRVLCLERHAASSTSDPGARSSTSLGTSSPASPARLRRGSMARCGRRRRLNSGGLCAPPREARH